MVKGQENRQFYQRSSILNTDHTAGDDIRSLGRPSHVMPHPDLRSHISNQEYRCRGRGPRCALMGLNLRWWRLDRRSARRPSIWCPSSKIPVIKSLSERRDCSFKSRQPSQISLFTSNSSLSPKKRARHTCHHSPRELYHQHPTNTQPPNDHTSSTPCPAHRRHSTSS